MECPSCNREFGDSNKFESLIIESQGRCQICAYESSKKDEVMSDIKVGSKWVNCLCGNEVEVFCMELLKDRHIKVRYRYLASNDESFAFKSQFLRNFKPVNQSKVAEELASVNLAEPKAVEILKEAVAVMAERGKSYDTTGQGSERSMQKIVAMFNALTGHDLTTAQGWKFMCCLKLARSEQGEHRDDNYLDGAAYFALAGEAASETDV